MTADRETRPFFAAFEPEYEIVGELGRGGVSVVYLARDRELGREVAIKVIRESFQQDAEATARFEREARTLAQLSHPNIVTLYAARRLPDASLALVMQVTRGASLRALLRQHGPFPAERAERVMRDIANALAYVHGLGIIHRDIKPENIFFDEKSGRALLSDFGIAKAYDGLANVTLAGVVVGTPAYMSPEQIDGAQLDGLSDLYSLGLVGHELLTGRQPWEGENLYNIIIKQKSEQLPALESVRSDVPVHLRVAIERALRKERAERWRSAEEFLAQLDARAPTASPLPAPLPMPVAVGVNQALALRADGSTIAFDPTSLVRPARMAPVPRLHKRAYVAAAVGILGVGAFATIPLVIDELPNVPAARAAVSDVPFTLAAQPAGRPGDPVNALVPQRAPRADSRTDRAATAAATAAHELRDAGTARLSTLDANPPVARELAAPSAPVVASPTPPALEVRSGRAVMSGLIVSRPAVAPVLQNSAAVERLMQTLYSSILWERHTSGTVRVLLLIDERGSVIGSQVTSSSGSSALDDAALRVGRYMKFSPAEDAGERVRTHVEVPLVFQPATRDE